LDLHQLGTLISFPLVQLWDARSKIYHFAVLDLKVRFKNTYLGYIWAAVEPLLTFAVLYVVFTSLRQAREDFAIYLISGIIFYHIFVRGTNGGLASLTSNGGILKSISIKKEFFPVVATTAIGLLAFVDIAVFFGLMPIFQFTPFWTIIFLPILILLVLGLILGLSYFLSIANAFARDIQHIWAILVHTLIFISPIFWYLDEAQGIVLELQKINPLGQIIELSHILVVDKEIPPLNDWLYTTSFVVVILLVGYFVFSKYEERVVEEL